MVSGSAQLGLFDGDPVADHGAAGDGQAAAGQAVVGRARMRGMIDRLAAATVPPWRDQMGVILDDGAFQRAMRLVPEAEAQALWAEFDGHMERLSAILFGTEAAPGS